MVRERAPSRLPITLLVFAPVALAGLYWGLVVVFEGMLGWHAVPAGLLNWFEVRILEPTLRFLRLPATPGSYKPW